MARSSSPFLVFVVGAVVVSACGGSPTGPGGGTGGSNSTNPPTISCPSAPPPAMTIGTSQPVAYGTPIVSGGQTPIVGPTCTPISGSTFPLGTTPVTCTVTDAVTRTASCTFNVVVSRAPQISLTRFMAFGDSITWGEDGRFVCGTITALGRFVPMSGLIRPECQFPSTQTYPGVLEQQLQGRYVFQTPTVKNQGCPGEQASGDCNFPNQPAITALARFQGLIATHAYDAALMMEGSNDLGGGSISQVTAINNLRTMIRTAKTNNVRPFLATIAPMVVGSCNPQCGGNNASLVSGYNVMVAGLALQEGVTLVDINAALATNAGQYIGPDGLHPTAAGYQRIADTFFTVLRSALEVAAPPTTTSMPTSFAPAPPPTSVAVPAAASPRSPVRRRP